MTRLIPIVLALLCLTGFTCLCQVTPSVVFESVQKETGWKADRQARIYDSKSLANLRSKDALIVEEYGFRQAVVQEFEKDGKSILCELLEMEDVTAAYGVFTFLRSDRAKPLQGIGHLGEQRDSSVSFMQNRYYVMLSLETPSRSESPALLRIGQAVSQALPKAFQLPPIVARLPAQNLAKGSEFFFLGFRALNQKLPIGNSDIFGLANGAEGVMAEYHFPGDSAKLVLIYYPTQQLARKYLESGYHTYMAQDPNESLFFKRDGPQVALVLGAKSAESATSLLDKISYVSTVSWDPKAQPIPVARIMLNIFIYTGVMLALTLGAGLLFALARILLKRFYPGRFFDRPEVSEIIRLNLKP
jgi:uncharacterized protein DUF6599